MPRCAFAMLWAARSRFEPFLPGSWRLARLERNRPRRANELLTPERRGARTVLMDATPIGHPTAETYNRRIRELASDLADRVRAGEMTELEANEALVAAQDRWSD